MKADRNLSLLIEGGFLGGQGLCRHSSALVVMRPNLSLNLRFRVALCVFVAMRKAVLIES